MRAVLNNSFGFGGHQRQPDHEGRVRRLLLAASAGLVLAALAHDLFSVVGRRAEAGACTTIIVKEGSTLGSLSRAAGEAGRDPGHRGDLLRHGAAVRFHRSHPGRRIRDSKGHGRRRGARPFAARQAGPAADHGHRGHALDHRRGEARRHSLSDRPDAAIAEGSVLPDSYGYQRGESARGGSRAGCRRRWPRPSTSCGRSAAPIARSRCRNRRSSSRRSSRRRPASRPSGR